MSADQMQRVLNALVAQVPLTYHRHNHRDEKTKQNDYGVNVDVKAYQ